MAGLLLGMFALGSGRALWEAAKLSGLDLFGQTVAGRIVAVKTAPRVKGQALRQASFRYEAAIPTPHGTQTLRGWVVLGAPDLPAGIDNTPAALPPAPQFRLGQSFPLRCASFFGVTVRQPWGPHPGSRILALWLAGGLVLSVSLLLLRRLGRWAGSRLHLLRFGTATVGTITHTRTETEDMARYFLRFGYAGGAAQVHDREEQVSADQWRAFQIGQPVTVLFDPEHPEQAGLYALIASQA